MLDANGHAVPADPTRSGYQFAGISQAATAAGQVVQACISGMMSDPAWSWAPGKALYVGMGALTQTPPTSGTLHNVGVAMSVTDIIVAPRSTFLLASGS